MDVSLTSFSSELVKLAQEKEQKKGYLKQIVAASPVAAATSASELPLGYLEKSIEHRINPALVEHGSSALGHSIGRATARFGVGLATTPVFVSGMKDLKSDDATQRRKGLAKVLGAGAAFGVGRGGVEAAIAQAASKKPELSKVLAGMKRAATSRGLLGIGGAALTAASIAHAGKRHEGTERPNPLKRYGVPLATGALLGGGKGAFEHLVEQGEKVTRRSLAGAVTGRAVGGALGAAVLDRAFEHFTKGKEKKADATADLYTQVSSWAAGQSTDDLHNWRSDLTTSGIGERTQPRRAALYAVNDELRHRGVAVPEEQRRKELVRAPGVLSALTLATVSSAPSVVGTAVALMPPEDADHLLVEALDYKYVRGKISHVVGDSPTSYSGTAGPHPSITTPGSGKTHAGAMAHEIGHATAGQTRAELAEIADRVGEVAAVASTVLPILVVMSSGDNHYATREELERRATFLNTLGVAAGAAQLPRLAEEALASAKAVIMLHKAGDTHAISRVVAQAGPGFLSYLAPAAIPFLAASILRAKARGKEAR